MKYLFIIILLFSCQKHKGKPPIVIDSAVKEKAELYKSLRKGWAHSKCDSLGFTSLCLISGGCVDANIFEAEGEDGRWYRSPEKDCYDLGQSASDISKDMFVMLFPYLYITKNKAALVRIYDYATTHGNIMGRGPISRTFMTPSLMFLLQRLIGVMPLDAGYSDEKEIEKAGYEKHLDMINAVVMGLKDGSLNKFDFDLMKTYAEESPKNALAQAIYHKYKDGDQSAVISILLDEKLFPSDKLPTARDNRCEEYLWQRDFHKSDWEPCEQDYTHDGVDFLFAAWVAGQI